MRPRLANFMLVAICGMLLPGVSRAAEPEAESSAAQEEVIAALEEFNLLVGDWRGVGQPKRGSTQGAWQEKGSCKWQLKKGETGLVWTAESGKQWSTAFLTFDPEAKQYALKLTLPDETTRSYTGTFAKQKLVAESPTEDADDVHRLTISILNENRLTVVFEQRTKQQSFYNRVAEIGLQRQGTKLAATDGNGPVCVVTGGQGTIAVTHKGKTYFVCCTGCRDAFNDDPEGILALWEAKKSKK